MFSIQCSKSASLESQLNMALVEIERLSEEIDELKNGPQRMLIEIKNLYENSKFEDAIKLASDLHKKFNGCAEDIEGQKISQSCSVSLKNIEDKRIAEEKAAAIKKATASLRTESDDIKGITWYYDKTTTKYRDVNNFHMYFGKKATGLPWLRMCVQYTDDDWLFMERIYLKTGENTYTIDFDYFDVDRENSSGRIWEWCDFSPTEEQINIVQDIIKNNECTIRLEGDTYYQDRKLSSNEIKALSNILTAYDSMCEITD